MPQMAPMIWSGLFMLFMALLIMTMAKLFFSSMSSSNSPLTSLILKSKSLIKAWQW